MTPKQKKFCDEYLISLNGTQAAIKAGYSVRSARQLADRLMSKVDIRTYIQSQLEQMQKSTIASAEEVMEYLTRVVRGESSASEIVVEGCGDGVSEAKIMDKPPSEKDRLKAAELLGKRYALFTDKTQVEGAVPIVISGENNLEE